MPLFANDALLVIDVQTRSTLLITQPNGPRNNPDAESNKARLLATWRQANRPIIHIRLDSTIPTSSYRPHQPGNEFKEWLRRRRARL